MGGMIMRAKKELRVEEEGLRVIEVGMISRVIKVGEEKYRVVYVNGDIERRIWRMKE